MTTGGALGDISISVADSASAVVGNIFASAVGAITLNGEGDGVIRFQGVTGTDAIGAIRVSAIGESDIDIGAISGSGTIGEITINVGASATADFSTIDANRVGAITVNGSTGGWVDFGTISASAVAGVDARGLASGGTFNIDLSGVDTATEIYLGQGTNTVISGKGNDVLTLVAGRTAAAGNDTIRYNTGTQGTDNIINFIGGAAASGGDVIALNGSGMILENGDGTTADASDDVSLLILGSTSSAMAATANIVVMTSAAASTAAMINQVSSQLSFGSAMASAQSNNILVVWTDGTDSYLTTVVVGLTGATSTTTAFASAASVTAGNTLAVLQGVSPGALVAANFDFV